MPYLRFLLIFRTFCNHDRVVLIDSLKKVLLIKTRDFSRLSGSEYHSSTDSVFVHMQPALLFLHSPPLNLPFTLIKKKNCVVLFPPTLFVANTNSWEHLIHKTFSFALRSFCTENLTDICIIISFGDYLLSPPPGTLLQN